MITLSDYRVADTSKLMFTALNAFNDGVYQAKWQGYIVLKHLTPSPKRAYGATNLYRAYFRSTLPQHVVEGQYVFDTRRLIAFNIPF